MTDRYLIKKYAENVFEKYYQRTQDWDCKTYLSFPTTPHVMLDFFKHAWF